MDWLTSIILLVVGAGVGWLLVRLRLSAQHGDLARQAQLAAERIAVERETAQRAAELQAKEAQLAAQEQVERELAPRRRELAELQQKVRQREDVLEERSRALEQREREVRQREASIAGDEQRAREQLTRAHDGLERAQRELERVAKLSEAEAKEQLIAAVADQARRDAAALVKRIEEEAEREAGERAARVVAAAMQRYAGEVVGEKTVSVVELPSDEMKGRIIGREGRNVRALEAATGVDVVIDDTPEAVIVSAFDPVRREIAKLSLERLVADGRIHPARIEEIVEQVTRELDEVVRKHGEEAAHELSLHGLHPELLTALGRLRYRVVAGQNALAHSLEVGHLAGLLATELGSDSSAARRAGLLHDVGMVADHALEGHHADAGADVARRLGEKEEIVAAIRTHEDPDPPTLLCTIVHVANVLSKARPGARRDNVDTYVKRLDQLERIAKSFAGVDKAFAVQAGREVRVIVDFARVAEGDTLALSQDIARRIQDELTYPGEVRVTVVREARATEIAR